MLLMNGERDLIEAYVREKGHTPECRCDILDCATVMCNFG